jgi:cystathionine beta-synthase
MAAYGFLHSPGATVGDMLESRDVDIPPLVYVRPHTRVREIIELMGQHGVSQVPVAKGDMPLAAAEVMGAIDELHLMERAFVGDGLLDRSAEEVMVPPLPSIGVGQPIELAVSKLDSCPALLVLDGGRPRAVVSRSDVLTYLSHRANQESLHG